MGTYIQFPIYAAAWIGNFQTGPNWCRGMNSRGMNWGGPIWVMLNKNDDSTICRSFFISILAQRGMNDVYLPQVKTKLRSNTNNRYHLRYSNRSLFNCSMSRLKKLSRYLTCLDLLLKWFANISSWLLTVLTIYFSRHNTQPVNIVF